MVKERAFIFFILSIFGLSANAGEYSKIDYAVRFEVSRFFATSYESVSSLEVVDNNEGCFMTVKANVSEMSQWGKFSYETLSCVNREVISGMTSYESVVIDYQIIINE